MNMMMKHTNGLSLWSSHNGFVLFLFQCTNVRAARQQTFGDTLFLLMSFTLRVHVFRSILNIYKL